MIIQRHYENLNIMYENTMPYRSYYIPASCNMGPLVENNAKNSMAKAEAMIRLGR